MTQPKITGDQLDLTGVTITGYVKADGTVSMTGNLTLSKSGPMVSLLNTGSRSGFLHNTTDKVYLKAGAVDATTATQISGVWPFSIDLTNNDAAFGGAIVATGNITGASDARLKTNWSDLSDTFVEDLSRVKMGTFDRTDIACRQVGVSAQSLQEVMPEAVLTSDEGFLSVAYGNAALAACIRLAQEVVELKKQVAELKAA
jgi:hypothetical protein